MASVDMLVSDGGNGEAADTKLLERRYGAETNASLGVVDAVAALEGIDPVDFTDEVGVTLRDSIDPKALDTIVGDGGGNGDVTIEFAFLEYRIRVTDDGWIRVYERG